MAVLRKSTTGKKTGSTPLFSPLYRQIRQLILQGMQQGEWKPGEALPSEMELALRFGVSQGTVRKAIDELTAENLLLRRQGKGTFVATHAQRQVRYRFLRLEPDDDRKQKVPVTQRRILFCRKVRAGPEQAQRLALPRNAQVLHIRRVLSLAESEGPTVLEDIWLPASRFDGLTLQRLQECRSAMYEMFELEFGVHMVRAEERLKAVLPDSEQAELLGVAPGTPLLSVQRLTCTYGEQPVELRQGLYRTDTRHYRNVLN